MNSITSVLYPWLVYRLRYAHYQLVWTRWWLGAIWRRWYWSRRLGCLTGVWLATGGVVYGLWRYYCRRGERCEDERHLSKWRKSGLPPGLHNDGNTCFANCVMQALAASSLFLLWTEQRLKTQKEDLPLVNSINDLLQVLRNVRGNEDTYSMSDVMIELREYGWMYTGEEQDADEFYQVLLSSIDDEIKKEENRVKSAKSMYDSDSFLLHTKRSSVRNRACKSLPCVTASCNNPPLCGSFANRMVCVNCGHQKAIMFEEFGSLIFSLANMNPYEATLQHCLQALFTAELVHSVDCDQCTNQSSFSKQYSIAKLPRLLCIHLKRSYYTNSGHTQKNNMHVSFPELLDLTDYTFVSANVTRDSRDGGSQEGKDFKRSASLRRGSYSYRLVAVIVHFGRLTGHFAVYRKLSDGRWIFISDNEVRVTSAPTVFLSTAYLLFYEKIS